ncbi:MAG TPA: exodeoxyribonuclease VII large subunit, partial [Alistipes obesi]|nr:exodeoxyribonuclease VII large subunit [Alistipes communis]
ELLLSYSVERVLRRGFAVVRRGGEALRSAEGLSPGDRLDITLADGEVQAAVVACTKKKR